MIIMQLTGGLGNQMFQYACYLKLKSLGREVKFDDISGYQTGNARPIQLAVFDIIYPRADKTEIVEMRDASPSLRDRIRRKLKGRNLRQYIEKDYSFDPHIYELDDVYLIGYFQSDKYFSGIEDELRRTFVLREDLLTTDVKRLGSAIDQIRDSVSIHIRRGDYMSADGADIYRDICTDEYYDAAVNHILSRYPGAIFYLFTNDVTWGEYFANTHPELELNVMTGNTEYSGYLDMYLMSRCRHHIVANSSFSWWGAWMNADPDGCVIAPGPWLNSSTWCSDIHTSAMTLISPEGEVLN
ncbi:MAG: alpha-1,2-fucosyltransferase [Lachnospiraceae bacterium]|nr:alpha-1,2-fucosyltransferase [Lachnospiraceae bacterium]